MKNPNMIAAMALAGALCLTPAFAKTAPVSANDQKFMKDAAQGGMAEVELGRLAAEKASSADVKAFGQRMVDDHSKANDKLKALASEKGVTLPADMKADAKEMRDKLAKMSGAEFDKMYMHHMHKDHVKDVAEFEKEASKGGDADVRSFASTTLPTLKEHLKMAKSLDTMGGGDHAMKSGKKG
jgi:putative membrane protein